MTWARECKDEDVAHRAKLRKMCMIAKRRAKQKKKKKTASRFHDSTTFSTPANVLNVMSAKHEK